MLPPIDRDLFGRCPYCPYADHCAQVTEFHYGSASEMTPEYRCNFWRLASVSARLWDQLYRYPDETGFSKSDW